MECAVDWRLTDDNNNLMYNKTDVARFLSFICGGSEDRIRKRLDEEISSKEMNEIIPYLESIGLHKIAERLKNKKHNIWDVPKVVPPTKTAYIFASIRTKNVNLWAQNLFIHLLLQCLFKSYQ